MLSNYMDIETEIFENIGNKVHIESQIGKIGDLIEYVLENQDKYSPERINEIYNLVSIICVIIDVIDKK